MIDLRSDTVTKPPLAMREAIAAAEVGDDVFEEDPTVQRLEQAAAERLGKEAGLLTASGTMGNLVALLTHASPGDEVILEADSHIFNYEAGGAARVAGLMPRLVSGRRGTFDSKQLAAVLRPDNIHFPPTTLVCMENTHNASGGSVLDQPTVQETAAYARERGLALHLDGARIFNAAAAADVEPAELCEPFDSVMFCLSKGLAAPVGSVLVGSRGFIQKARQRRKLLGGGMRQAGVIAAAGIYALEVMAKRLTEDHRRARCLADALTGLGLTVMNEVATNIINIRLSGDLSAYALLSAWRSAGVAALPRDEKNIRLVLHYEISDDDVTAAVAALAQILG